MDWKVFLATFTTIFFAELADKTQIIGIGMSAKSGKPLAVLAGSVFAYFIRLRAVHLRTLLLRWIRSSEQK